MPVFSRGVALGLWLLCISQGLGAAPESLSYADALRLALHSAPQNEAAAAGLKAAQVVRQAAGELPDPQLILGLDNLPLDGRERFSLNQDPMTQRRLGVMQSVPNAAKRAAREQQAEAEIGLALAAGQLSQRQSRLQAALAWLELYYLEQRQPLLAQWRQAVAMQRDSLPAALAEGRSTPAEWLQLDQQWLLLDERDEELQRDLQAARSQLARWIGAAAWQSLQGPPPQRTLDAAQLQAALQQHPDLQVQRARVVQADAGLQQALAEKRPDWAVEVAYGNRAGYGDMLMLEWRVDLPLFVGSRQGPRIAAQRHRHALAVILDDVALHHLGLRLVVLVEAVQRVPHHVAVVARDVGGGQDRVQHRQVGLRDELQQLRGARRALAERGHAHRGSAEDRTGPGQKFASFHGRRCLPGMRHGALRRPAALHAA